MKYFLSISASNMIGESNHTLLPSNCKDPLLKSSTYHCILKTYAHATFIQIYRICAKSNICLWNFLILLPFTLTLNMLNEFCRAWDVVLGFFAVSVNAAWSDLRVNLSKHPLLGRLWHNWMLQIRQLPKFLITLADDQLINALDLQHLAAACPLNSHGSRRVDLVFPQDCIESYDNVLFQMTDSHSYNLLYCLWPQSHS